MEPTEEGKDFAEQYATFYTAKERGEEYREESDRKGCLIMLNLKTLESYQIHDDPETKKEGGKYIVLNNDEESFPLGIIEKVLCLDERSYLELESFADRLNIELIK
jgi:hypothetical protein